jgi:DNA invertase Pin-like site-specific DNA recombinase
VRKPKLARAADVQEIADYCVDRIKLKCRSPRIAVRFMDGDAAFTHVPSVPGKPLNVGRALRVAIAMWRSRRAVQQRLGFQEYDRAMPVPEIFQVRCLETDELFDPELCNRAKTDRRYLQRAIEALNSGDVLLVTRLDRLARSPRDLLNVLASISERGADFRSIADAWADTTTPHGRLMVTFLGGLAEFERELIRARTDDGRKRAMARGARFGRKPKLTSHQIQEALARRAAGEPLVEIGRSYNVSHSTISRL